MYISLYKILDNPKLDLNIGDQSDSSENEDNMMEEENIDENGEGGDFEDDQPSDEFEEAFINTKLGIDRNYFL